jgi:acyl carrier protein
MPRSERWVSARERGRQARLRKPLTSTRIRRIVAGVMDLDATRIDDEDDFIRDLGTDSLRVLEIMVAIEKEFRVTFEESELRHFTCVKDLTALVASRQ